jgi:transcriptional regulator with XRE-family HTH domain
MKRGIIERIKSKIPLENRKYISKNLDISNQVFTLLDQKGITQKEFSALLEKNESEVSRWLSGRHNLTLKSIVKMESILDSDIITTPIKAEKKYGGVKYIVYHTQEIKSIEEAVGYTPQWEIQQKKNIVKFQDYKKLINA